MKMPGNMSIVVKQKNKQKKNKWVNKYFRKDPYSGHDNVEIQRGA